MVKRKYWKKVFMNKVKFFQEEQRKIHLTKKKQKKKGVRQTHNRINPDSKGLQGCFAYLKYFGLTLISYAF